MNCLLRLLALVAIFAMWGQAKAYEVALDINVEQSSNLTKNQQSLSGEIWLIKDGERHQLDLELLKMSIPTDKTMQADEWIFTWFGEQAPELIEQLGLNLDPDLVSAEIDVRRQSLRCRGSSEIKCHGKLSVKLTLSRS